MVRQVNIRMICISYIVISIQIDDTWATCCEYYTVIT